MTENAGDACPDWCRRHRGIGPGEVPIHESLAQVATAEIDDVPVDLSVSATLWDGLRGPQRGVVIRTGGGLVIDLDHVQAKRLCTLLMAATVLP